MAEHQTKDLAVTGSTPVPRPQAEHLLQRGPREAGQRVIGHRRSVSPFRSTRALRGWQHVRVPCSAWIPLPPATGQAAVDVRRLASGLAPATTSRTEAAVRPMATWMLKRHSALVRVIAAGSAARRLFCSD